MITLLYKPLLWLYRRAGRQQRKVIQLPLELLRRVLTRLGNPSYTTRVRGVRLRLPVSHDLPLTVAANPLYDTLPARVASHVRRRRGSLAMIDVGANVGDTIAACAIGGTPADRYLAIEPTPRFAACLARNTRHLPGVVSLRVQCGADDDPTARAEFDIHHGSARMSPSAAGRTMPRRTLDSLVAEHPGFAGAGFLKVDTDGSDFAVVAGATHLLAAARPVTLIESQVFDNPRYVDDVLATVERFAAAGYGRVIAYDRVGHRLGAYPLRPATAILPAVAYQLVADLGNLDLLFLGPDDLDLERDEAEFAAAVVAGRGSPASVRGALGL